MQSTGESIKAMNASLKETRRELKEIEERMFDMMTRKSHLLARLIQQQAAVKELDKLFNTQCEEEDRKRKRKTTHAFAWVKSVLKVDEEQQDEEDSLV